MRTRGLPQRSIFRGSDPFAQSILAARRRRVRGDAKGAATAPGPVTHPRTQGLPMDITSKLAASQDIATKVAIVYGRRAKNAE
ncbi:MAG TPA: hypothetical protein VFX05_19540, partial [Casimicrobiaceae bacterium]|nr:hypothetical protein [Casimicrobiaceae bacterium]